MANEMQDAIGGLVALLETIPELQVFEYPVEPSDPPAAFITFNGRTVAGEDGLALGGSSFTAELTITVLISKSLTKEATELMYEFINPLGAKSIEAAIDADNTWNSTVDDGRLIAVEEIDPTAFPSGAQYTATDFRVRFTKQVTS